MAFKIGDMVKRTSGSWRGVNEGDIKTVSSVHGGNIQLEGYPDITFDGYNFALYQRPGSAPLVEFERGQTIIYKYHDGNTYTGKVQDLSVSMLGVIRGTTGAYDAVNKTDVLSVEISLTTARYKVGEQPSPMVIMTQPVVPDISVDEAVEKCQTLRKQIADLQIELKTYEQVMLRHNLKPI